MMCICCVVVAICFVPVNISKRISVFVNLLLRGLFLFSGSGSSLGNLILIRVSYLNSRKPGLVDD